MSRLLQAILFLGALLISGQAHAHLTPDSQVVLTVGQDQVRADIMIPASEYAYATGNPAQNSPAAIRQAKAYLLANAGLAGADGRDWAETIETLNFAKVEGPEDLFATMTFRPPAGVPTDRFTLLWSPVLAETGDHFATILVAGEGAANEPRLVGLLRQSNTELDIEAGRSSALARFAGAVRLGIEHILAGLDHLAFLLALLLASPMVADRGRWVSIRRPRHAIRSLALVATGFTIGHSLTLLGVAAAGISLPSSVVEPLIAVTVLLAAIHAIRPLLARREILVATVFGLIHGLGFAGFVQEADANVARSFPTLIGFNVGIEIVQIAIVALFVPVLFWLVRKGAYAIVRPVLATVIAVASLYWIVSRIGLTSL